MLLWPIWSRLVIACGMPAQWLQAASVRVTSAHQEPVDIPLICGNINSGGYDVIR